MADLVDDHPAGAAWDEVFDHTGAVRAAYAHVRDTLVPMSETELRGRADALARSYLHQGVTFDFAGEERPFPLDVAPRVIDGDVWDTVSPGVAQRVRELEAFLADVYGEQRAVTDGVVPHSLITSSTHVHRAAHGIEPPNGVRVQVAGIDLVGDEAGDFRVLEDNVRVPSGVSYVLSNHRAMARTRPSPSRPARAPPRRSASCCAATSSTTAVHTPEAEAWDARTGVCQDMAHPALGALRSVGIPARYVSGYLHPTRGAEPGQTGTGESHAWVEWWTGQWTGFDPTNRAPAGEHHVVLACGREYQDVAPLRGIYAGTDALDVQVQITQEA